MVLETKIPDIFKDILTDILAALLMGKQTKQRKRGNRDQKKRRNGVKGRAEQCGKKTKDTVQLLNL